MLIQIKEDTIRKIECDRKRQKEMSETKLRCSTSVEASSSSQRCSTSVEALCKLQVSYVKYFNYGEILPVCQYLMFVDID